MLDLDAEMVIAAWPAEGAAGVRCIADFLDGEVLAAVSDPTGVVVAGRPNPLKRTRSDPESGRRMRSGTSFAKPPMPQT